MRTIEEEIERQRLSDELRNIGMININQMANETYEDNLRRRAELEIRKDEILSKLYEW